MLIRSFLTAVLAVLLMSCGPVPEGTTGARDKVEQQEQRQSYGSATYPASVSETCRKYGGAYSTQHRECDASNICQGGSIAAQGRVCFDSFQTACRRVGGRYDACASPCRHQLNVRACIMSCVAVCRG